MDKYVTQPHASTCAPIAAINIAAWLNYPLTMDNDYVRICVEMKCYDNGTMVSNIDKFIKNEFKDHLISKKIRKYTYTRLKKHIKNKGSVLLSYSFIDENKEEGCHIALFTAIDKNQWIGHNITSQHSTSSIPSEEIFKYLYEGPRKPSIWLLSKKENNIGN